MSTKNVVLGIIQERKIGMLLLTFSISLQLVACQQHASQSSTTNANLGHAAEAGQSTPLGKAASCPAKDFDAFLKKFASDKKIQLAYTLPLVSVVDYLESGGGGGDSEATKKTRIPREKYRDFTLKYENGAFHNVDPVGDVDSAPENVKIEMKGPNYYVHYIHGMSEGNSWLFEPKNGCWFLSKDPEPPPE